MYIHIRKELLSGVRIKERLPGARIKEYLSDHSWRRCWRYVLVLRKMFLGAAVWKIFFDANLWKSFFGAVTWKTLFDLPAHLV